MIRRDFTLDDGRAGWLLVPQIAHAELAGNLANSWRLDGIPPDLATDLRTAIHRHDDGWADWDSRPAVDPISGRPIEFDEMHLADSLAIWSRSIDLATLRGPLLGYFVAGHFTRLLRRFDSWRGDPAREELAREFLTREDGNMSSWLDAAKANRQEADRGVAYLQFFDAVSLWLCCAEREESRRIELIRGEGWTFSPAGQDQGCRLVRIEPWPLTVGSCKLSVRGRAVPGAHYRSTDEMLAVAAAIEIEIGRARYHNSGRGRKPHGWGGAMKAAYIERVGSPNEIHFSELPEPVVGPSDVLVRVGAVAVDPVDTYIRAGRVPMQLPLPFIIGRDMVGTVERVGTKVSRFAPGDRVWANNQGFAGRQGTFAERLAIDEKLIYLLPPGVDEQQMVAFVHSALTALIGLERAGLKAGESIYVQGGAGNVGSAIAQFAIARSAKVFTTAGDADAVAWCRTIGVDFVGNYKTDDLATEAGKVAPGGFDVFWDASGHIDFDQAIGVLKVGGRIVVMAGLAARPQFPVGPFYVKNCTLHGFAVTYATPDDYDRAAAQINHFVAGGKLRARIDRVLPLAEAAAAHRLVDEGARLRGKLVLVP